MAEEKMTSDLWLAKTHEAQTRLIRAEQNLEVCKLAAERATSEKNRADCELSNARNELTRLMIGKIDATELRRLVANA